MYDIPAELNYILNVTGQKKLTYVGHSMGNAIVYITIKHNESIN